MLTLAWDIDDVLNELMRTWFEAWWRPRHPSARLKLENLAQNPPHQILGVGLHDYLHSLDEFRLSGQYAQMSPDSQVLEWFKHHGARFRHTAVTAVPRKAAPISAAWLIRHFGDWIRSFHFIPSARAGDIPTDYEPTKATYLKWLNRIDIFIDDNACNVQEAAVLGIRCFLVARPWNSGGMQITKILETLTHEI
jgi:hypothetical protein